MLANIARLMLLIIVVGVANFGAYKAAVWLFAHGSSSAFDLGVFICVLATMLNYIAIYFLFDKKQWE